MRHSAVQLQSLEPGNNSSVLRQGKPRQFPRQGRAQHSGLEQRRMCVEVFLAGAPSLSQTKLGLPGYTSAGTDTGMQGWEEEPEAGDFHL